MSAQSAVIIGLSVTLVLTVRPLRRILHVIRSVRMLLAFRRAVGDGRPPDVTHTERVGSSDAQPVRPDMPEAPVPLGCRPTAHRPAGEGAEASEPQLRLAPGPSDGASGRSRAHCSGCSSAQSGTDRGDMTAWPGGGL